MKLFLGFFAAALTLGALAAAGSALWLSHEFQKPGPLKEAVILEIEKGTGIGGVAEVLLYRGALESTADVFLFKNIGRITGQHKNLKAGEYELQPGMSMQNIMDLLHSGKTYVRRFTIPEGRTSYEIVQLLNAVEGLTGKILEPPPEGSLLPNTYDYQLHEPREKVMERLQDTMIDTILGLCEKKFDRADNVSFSDLLKMECERPPLKTIGEVLTLASIIEKETGLPQERRRIAGVFLNRLNRGIPLQTDPTVIYALTKGQHEDNGKGPLGRRLLKKDLAFDSPYNTYLYPGLPPGPIANPGRASIEAALHPEAHDYIYFVADGTGGHVFAATLDEHNKNVARWRKIRKERGQ